MLLFLKPAAMHTHSEENYLKIIHKLAEGCSGRISTNAVAAALSVNAASVSEKMKRMAAKGLLEYEKSKGVRLSPEGEKIALGIIRKHRIWESFLVKTLEFGWEEVHEIAEQLEHIRSDKLISRLEEHLGYPRFDPHGDPIPDAGGRLETPCFAPLSGFAEGRRARIAGVREDSEAFLRFFARLGLEKGDELEIQEKEPFDQSVRVCRNGDNTLHLSREVAANILVTEKKDCCLFTGQVCRLSSENNSQPDS